MKSDNKIDIPDINSILPYGEKLLPLLKASYITKTDINRLLRNRGIYIDNSDNEKPIGLLRNIIISPDEFEFLRNLQKTKEDRIKNRSEFIEINSEKKLYELIEDKKFTVNKLINGKNLNYTIDGVSSINFIDENHAQYRYRINRIDINKNWSESKSSYSGCVDFEKKEHQLIVSHEYTSEETKLINLDIKKHIYKDIKNVLNYDNDLKPIKITYDSFSNESRINFLFSFFEGNELFTLDRVTDISFGPDPKQKILPSEIKWMEDKIKALILKGKGVKDIEYFTNKKYHKMLLLETIDAIFYIVIENEQFFFALHYGFDKYLKTEIPDTEFEYSINGIKDKKKIEISMIEI